MAIPNLLAVETSPSPPAGCTPRTKVGFLKTHKTASTTVQNILMRYGLAHNLSFVLPAFGHMFNTVGTFRRDLLKGTPWDQVIRATGGSYDMHVLHSRWNRPEISSLLRPGSDSPVDKEPFYFTVLRDPARAFESLWGYYGLGKLMNVSLEDFALEPAPHEEALKRSRFYYRTLWDFGLDPVHMTDTDHIASLVAQIESEFDLVLVIDAFQGSFSPSSFEDALVLLREALCWDMKDLVSFKLNFRKEGAREELSTEAEESLRAWLWPEYMVYDHFRERFVERVQALDQDRLQLEKRALRDLSEKTRRRCSIEQVDNSNLPDNLRLFGKNLVAYSVKDPSSPEAPEAEEEVPCKYYTMKEERFVEALADIQAKRSTDLANKLGLKLYTAQHLNTPIIFHRP